jgi:hypothetical protein
MENHNKIAIDCIKSWQHKTGQAPKHHFEESK